jgi:hypothetical protein
MTADNTSGRLDLDRIGELVARHDGDRTHWGDCCYAHLTCAVVALGNEVRRLREERDALLSNLRARDRRAHRDLLTEEHHDG